MRDYQESVTTGQTDRQMDAGQSDPYVTLCFEGDTKILFPFMVICQSIAFCLKSHNFEAMHMESNARYWECFQICNTEDCFSHHVPMVALIKETDKWIESGQSNILCVS